MTKQNALSNYIRSTAKTLRDVYAKPSCFKESAFIRCLRRQVEFDGYNGKVCSANSQTFSYAFTYKDETDKEFLCYITAWNEYHFEL